MPSTTTTTTVADTCNRLSLATLSTSKSDITLGRNSLDTALDKPKRATNSSGLWHRPSTSGSPQRSRSPSPLVNRLTRASHRQHRTHSPPAPLPILDRGTSSNGHHPHASSITSTGSPTKKRALLSTGGPLTLTREDFEALPPAIQRKYFSTLERLRFAQGSTSATVDGIYHHYNAISAQNFKRRKPRQDRVASESLAGRLRRRSLREPPSVTAATTDTHFYATLPEKIKKRQFTPEEQVYLDAQLKPSVILDAADEAVYRIGRRASTQLSRSELDIDLASLPSRHSMDTMHSDVHSDLRRDVHRDVVGGGGLNLSNKRSSGIPSSFYDSFRWLDEDDDLDLRLFLDDYHANLHETVPTPTKERRPSFRRHLSISKMAFSRPSTSTRDGGSQPASPSAKRISSSSHNHQYNSSFNNTPTSATTPFPVLPATSHSNAPAPPLSHTRRKSRTLSLITTKHAAQSSVSTIDQAAAHYQDPEARLKLRVYLASPQKFDEAIEFGFPATEVVPAAIPASASAGALPKAVSDQLVPLKQRKSRQGADDTTNGSEALRTFLADDDDDDKLDSDVASVPDPDSPKTPNPAEASTTAACSTAGMAAGAVRPSATLVRPYRVSTEPVSGHRPSDSYTQVPVSSREMTLRMTLTRPDLRAREEQIYGWQPQPGSPHQAPVLLTGRKSSQAPTLARDDSIGGSSGASYIGNGGSRPKESIEQVFAGIDHWGPDPSDNVMKRFWNRVRRS